MRGMRFLMLLALFSMAGIPPLAGFYAKLAVLKALVAAPYPWATWPGGVCGYHVVGGCVLLFARGAGDVF